MEEKILLTINGNIYSLSYKDNWLSIDAESLTVLGDLGHSTEYVLLKTFKAMGIKKGLRHCPDQRKLRYAAIVP